MGRTVYRTKYEHVVNDHNDVTVNLEDYEHETTLYRFERCLKACANHKGCMSFDLVEDKMCYLSYKAVSGDDKRLETDGNAVLGHFVPNEHHLLNDKDWVAWSGSRSVGTGDDRLQYHFKTGYVAHGHNDKTVSLWHLSKKTLAKRWEYCAQKYYEHDWCQSWDLVEDKQVCYLSKKKVEWNTDGLKTDPESVLGFFEDRD